MTCVQQLEGMSLEKLYAVRDSLGDSRDVAALVALRMVDTEIRLRRRSIREQPSG